MKDEGRDERERENGASGLALASEAEDGGMGDEDEKGVFVASGARDLSRGSSLSRSLPSPRFSCHNDSFQLKKREEVIPTEGVDAYCTPIHKRATSMWRANCGER